LKDIFKKIVIIKDYPYLALSMVFILSSILSYFIKLKTDTFIIIPLEQTLFIILSAVLFVFHDSMIGYENIKRIRDKIVNLKKPSNKNKIESVMGLSDVSLEIEEFVTNTDKEIITFKNQVRKFRLNSYILYVIFSILGLMAVYISLIESNFILLQSIKELEILTKVYIINFLLYVQMSLILVWIISAFQSEKQKSEILKYLNAENIAPNAEKYILDKRIKDIGFSTEGDIE
jgi:hypothetical protein